MQNPLFILANIETFRVRSHYYFGVGSLIAFLKSKGYAPRLLQITRPLDKGEFLKALSKYGPSIAAVSTNTVQWDYSRKLAAWIKDYADIPVIYGGAHPTILPDDVMEEASIDMLCVGEGEHAMLELLERLEKNEDYSHIKNLWVRTGNGEILKNPLRPLIEDLDSLPFPDRDSFDYPKLAAGLDFTTPMLTGLGCPYDCAFCYNQSLQKIFSGCGKYIRRHCPRYVADEVKWIKASYPIKRIFFWDDDFLLSEKWAYEFCDIYGKELKIPFGICTRADRINRPVLKALGDAGCRWIYYGVETGNEWLRTEILNKKITNDQLKNAFVLTWDAKIEPCATLMTHLPHETGPMIKDTMNLISEIRPAYSSLLKYIHLPGTRLSRVSENAELAARSPYPLWKDSSVMGVPDQAGEEYERLGRLNDRLCAQAASFGQISLCLLHLDKNPGGNAGLTDYSSGEDWCFALGYTPCLKFHKSAEEAFDITVPPNSMLMAGIGFVNPDEERLVGGSIGFSAGLDVGGQRLVLFEQRIFLEDHKGAPIHYTFIEVDLSVHSGTPAVIWLKVDKDGAESVASFWMNPIIASGNRGNSR